VFGWDRQSPIEAPSGTGDGGLGFGTVVTSGRFLAVVLGLAVYLTVTREDVADPARVTRQAA